MDGDTSFKSGAGGLNFDEDDDDDQEDDVVDEAPATGAGTSVGDSQGESQTDGVDVDTSRRSSPRSASVPGGVATGGPSGDHKYPYFVRRNQVGDERTERVEGHWRPEVKEAEGDFLGDLADALETDEVAKTDAREYAQIVAHENIQVVAERMREDGYGET